MAAPISAKELPSKGDDLALKRAHDAADALETVETSVEVATATTELLGMDGKALVNIGLGSLGLIGDVVQGLPFLAPLSPILKAFASAVLDARYNLEFVNMLKARVNEVVKVLRDLAPRMNKHSKIEDVMDPLFAALKEGTKWVENYSKKGFLSKMMSSTSDKFKLHCIDKSLTDSLQTVNTVMGSIQLDLQQQNLNQMQKMQGMLETLAAAGGNNANPDDMDPQMLADVATQAGCAAAEELADELQSVGLKMDQIGKAVDIVLSNLNAMDSKLDKLDGRFEEQAEVAKKQLSTQEEAMQENRHAHVKVSTQMHKLGSKMDEQLDMQRKQQDIMASVHAHAKKATDQTLEAVMRLAEASGATVLSWADKSEVREMHSYALQLLDSNYQVIHSHGVGGTAWVDLDGECGTDGTDGESHLNPAGTTNEHGDHGEPGGEGEPGGHGNDGQDCERFEVMIEFEAEDSSAGTRTYRVEHAGGPNGCHADTVTLKFPEQMIYVDGTGGFGNHGGKGGSGGNGQDGGPGSKDADGGDGGEAGDPALGGTGGNGGKGAEIKINTNDPALLMRLHVDCVGGEAGREGASGNAGKGGAGGKGGPGMPEYGMRTGRKGRSGKASKKPRRNAAGHGTPGQDGRFTLCVYREDGGMESGKKPYRLMYHPAQTPKPVPVNFDTPDPTAPYVYGQKLVFGPVRPTNTGGLTSPPSTLQGTIVGRSDGDNHVMSLTELDFPPVPPVKGTKNGELDKNFALTATLCLPPLGPPLVASLDQSFPFPSEWCRVPERRLVSEFRWLVDGLPFRRVKEDGDLRSVLRDTRPVIIPLDLVEQDDGSALKAPTHLALSWDSNPEFSLAVANQLDNVDVDTQGWDLVLRCAGFGFMCHVTAESPPGAAKEEKPSCNGWCITDYRAAVPPLPAQTGHTFHFSFSCPVETARPGAYLSLRPELHMSERCFVGGPPTFIRICPPPPPAAVESPTQAVLVFSYDAMRIEDYDAVERACTFLGDARAVFLEVGRFRDTDGTVPRSLWEGLLGKAVVVWAPPHEKLEAAVPQTDLEAHLAAGGALLTTDRRFSRQVWRHGRRIIADQRGLAVATTPADTQVELQDEAVERHLWPLVSAVLDAKPTEERLELLRSGSNMLNVRVGDWLAEGWHSVKEAASQTKGCCDCFDHPNFHPKFVAKYLGQTPVTVRDYLLASAATNVISDWHALQTGQHGPALAALSKHASAAKDSAMRGQVCALVDAIASAGGVPAQQRMGGQARNGAAPDVAGQWLDAIKEKAQAMKDSILETRHNGDSCTARLQSVMAAVKHMRARDATHGADRDVHVEKALRLGANRLRGFNASEKGQSCQRAMEAPAFLEHDPLPEPLSRVRHGRAGDGPKSVASAGLALHAARHAADQFKRALVHDPHTPSSSGPVASHGAASPTRTDSVTSPIFGDSFCQSPTARVVCPTSTGDGRQLPWGDGAVVTSDLVFASTS